jgi:dihydrofolate reductase
VIISIVVAIDEQRGIGVENRMPWHLPEDLKRFKRLTMGGCLVMGRKTYASIGRSLPGRTNIVISREFASPPEGVLVAASPEAALGIAEDLGEKKVFIIGGAQIYAQMLPLANRMYLTTVHTSSAADTFFPDFNPDDWRETYSEHHPADNAHAFAFTYQILVRKTTEEG